MQSRQSGLGCYVVTTLTTVLGATLAGIIFAGPLASSLDVAIPSEVEAAALAAMLGFPLAISFTHHSAAVSAATLSASTVATVLVSRSWGALDAYSSRRL